MKTIDPNVSFNHQANFWLEKNKQIMKQKLLLVLILVFFCSSIKAQSTRSGTIVVREMNSFLSTASSETTARTTTGVSVLNTDQVRDLITKVQPSVYFYSGDVKTYGDQPVNLFTDLGSLNQIDNSITLKDNIEIAIIRINTANELGSTIDLAKFSNFPNLKYIYFITNLETTSQNISSNIVNYDSRFNIFYKIDKGDSNQ
ncbi:hypothetical protein QWY90_09620 [Flavobacterium paronense]|uniref:Uncharacterized protein n=1 Tax=Flavobacterium paronense TaxID=1392775 RepID=A0ABV5GIK7_9FLAO|nr:hypothetical protein [Flavobacterium paronense]MDN3677573.1 hypothetical protein [Flavobacterium paronense]